MLARGLIDATPSLRAAAAPGLAVGRLRAGAVLPTRLCAAQHALRPLFAAGLGGLTDTTCGDAALRAALDRAPNAAGECAPTAAAGGERGAPAAGGRRAPTGDRLTAAGRGGPDGHSVTARRETHPSTGEAPFASTGSAPRRARSGSGRRPATRRGVPARTAVSTTGARPHGRQAPARRPAAIDVPTPPLGLERFAHALPTAADAAATPILRPVADSEAALAVARALVSRPAPPARARPGVAGEPAPAGHPAPTSRAPQASPTAAGATTHAPSTVSAGGGSHSHVAGRLAGDAGASRGSRPRPDDALAPVAAPVAAAPATIAAPGPGLAGLSRWWEESHDVAGVDRVHAAQAAGPPPAPAAPDPQALADAMGLLFRAEARRYGLEVGDA